MNALFARVDTGRKNMLFGMLLFLVLGIGAGIPLTVDFFGGTIFTAEQYQAWKVVHGYGVFLSAVNYFFGLLVDRLALTKMQKEISGWSFLLAGVSGGLVRMILLLASALDELGLYASLAETVFFSLGTILLVRGQLEEKTTGQFEHTARRPGILADPARKG